MKKTILTVSVLIVLALGGCGAPAPRVTATPAPTQRAPTAGAVTAPAAVTPTQAAEGASPTPTADLSAFAETSLKTSNGFSVQIPDGLILTRPEGGISAIGRGYLFGFFFRDYEAQNLLTAAVDNFFGELASRGFELSHGDPYEVTVQSMDGLAADFTGKIGKEPVAGQVLVLSPVTGKVFLAVGMATTDPADQKWAETGHALFQQILGTVTFGP